MKKYGYNENYFEKIDTEDKAYWLGFIAADGSIGETCGLEISLSHKDIKHLYKFADNIGAEKDIVKTRKIKQYEVCRLFINNKKIISDLSKYGIIQNKGFNLDFPNFLSDNMIKHYLRGYFDGDGSISTNGKNRNGSPKYALNLIATKSFLDKWMNHFHNMGITSVKLQSRGPVMSWNKVGINQIRTILSYLYTDCEIYLDRKHNYAKELLPS